ncbi:MAG: imidazole glycerol phosphate synthase subunit HisH [Paludibacter sp.]|nr:imidazole glycerol phosphate synthase subunit HisH [Paludibacter sp.]MDD4198651.1 imidazole glycerol phosphate synthase subunit HisH [Paludibacter sp.]MDD4428359.1 imidazole glycerol phosphate synthase subunit HisH [Paludibacter sp.]
MSKTVIIKYNAGNIRSVLFALERIGVHAVVTDNHDEISNADRVIFPGVGEASSAMQYLEQRGMVELIKSLKQPVLGICLGMQLMCAFSEENNTECLGIFDQRVLRFPEVKDFKVPQIGWNNITSLRSPLFEGVDEASFMYFVHGYYVEKCENAIATTNYIQQYSSAIQKDNFYAVQFHPEKSGDVGERILRNFIVIK